MLNSDFPVDFSGSISTLMNLKFPTLFSHFPFQRPLGFMEIISIRSPRCKKENMLKSFWLLSRKIVRNSKDGSNAKEAYIIADV